MAAEASGFSQERTAALDCARRTVPGARRQAILPPPIYKSTIRRHQECAVRWAAALVLAGKYGQGRVWIPSRPAGLVPAGVTTRTQLS